MPDHEFAMLFTSSREGARLARRIAVRRLRRWGIETDTPALLIGELAANAVTHCRVGRKDFFLRIAVSAGVLRIEVADKCPGGQPELIKPPEDAESGRGLLLVDALSSAWGVTERAGGKAVWCELALP